MAIKNLWYHQHHHSELGERYLLCICTQRPFQAFVIHKRYIYRWPLWKNCHFPVRLPNCPSGCLSASFLAILVHPYHRLQAGCHLTIDLLFKEQKSALLNRPLTLVYTGIEIVQKSLTCYPIFRIFAKSERIQRTIFSRAMLNFFELPIGALKALFTDSTHAG